MTDDQLQAVCVRGPTSSLGAAVLVHEHLLFDFTCRWQPAASHELQALHDEPITLARLAAIRRHSRVSRVNLRAPDAHEVAAELAALRDAHPSGCTVVDCTANGTGRDAAGLLALSEASGVHIVMAAGLSYDEASRELDEEEPDALANRLVAELTEGVAIAGRDQRVRAGVLTTGEVSLLQQAGESLAPEAERARANVSYAVGQAQMRTGAPIVCALSARAADRGGAEAVVQSVRELCQHGAAASSIVIAHAQNLLLVRAAGGGDDSAGRAALQQLLHMGAHLCFDGLGDCWAIEGAEAATPVGAAMATSPELQIPMVDER
jgi:predicted metal-dependent phosphotriesterase family hydrolase